ncbi:MAG: hypothetical protein F6K28_61020 [Microcoleus sp. SIO2G3]|nr:hypothetical protein [Microcoleus sp. SIO2G3]
MTDFIGNVVDRSGRPQRSIFSKPVDFARFLSIIGYCCAKISIDSEAISLPVGKFRQIAKLVNRSAF